MPTVEFHFDFGSPNAYLSHLVIPEIEARTGAKFTYVPVLLGGVFKATGNASPMETMAGIKNKPEYARLETERFIGQHGLADRYRRNPHFPVNTLQIMRGAVAARRLGESVYGDYIDTVYQAMWLKPVKMDDADVIRATLEATDLPAAEILAGMQDPDVKAELAALTANSVERGTFGSPTFFVDGDIYFGKDRLRDVEDLLASAKT